MSMTVTNIDHGKIVLWGDVYQDELLTFAGADTVLPGTILARATSTGKLIPFVKGGSTDGNGVPVAILGEVTVTATGAGDKPIRPLISGHVNIDRLVIHADGDASNIDNAVKDQLRTFTLIALSVKQHAVLDNQ